MAERQNFSTAESTEVQGRGREAQAAMRPPVEILEDSTGITLRADMPGVSKDRLNIQVDKDTLLIEGTVHVDMPEGMEALYADVRSTRYQRSFALSSELERDKIDAALKNGVLSVRIPKRAELQPRKIEVRTV